MGVGTKHERCAEVLVSRTLVACVHAPTSENDVEHFVAGDFNQETARTTWTLGTLVSTGRIVGKGHICRPWDKC